MYLIYFFQFIYYVIYMNKIKKFKKSKKTNNKRNHKRRRMTRKLRGGVIKPEWPLDKETPPQPLNGTSQPVVVSDTPMVVQPVVVSEKSEPSDKNLQSLEERIRLLEENATTSLTHLDREIQRFEERLNEIQQTDNTGELREQITALQRKIEQTEYDLTGIAEILIQEGLLDRDDFNSKMFRSARKKYTY